MTIRPPGWQQALTYTGENDRLANFPMFNPTGSGTSAHFIDSHGWDGGVGLTYANNNLKVTQRGAGANMSVDVAPGTSLIPGQTSTVQGMYTCTSDAITNLAIATAPGANSRIDLIYMTVADAGYSGVTNAASFGVVTGAVSGSPVVPPLPANAIPLARVAVGTSVTSIVTANITDVRIGLGAAGGMVQANSGFMPLYAPAGQYLYQPDTGKTKVFSLAGVWEDLYQPGDWVAFTPATGGLTLGNGTQLCTYSKVGRMVTANYQFRFNTTTTFGGGTTWTFGLPFTASAVNTAQQANCIGSWNGINATNYCGSVYVTSAIPTVAQLIVSGNGNSVNNAVPTTWLANTSNEVSLSITYRTTT